MREVELADAFGVSRQSLRAALAELVHVGLLRREAHRGVWVPQLTTQDVEDLYFTRGIIETAAVRKLLANPPTDWKGLDAAIDRQKRLPAQVAWSDVLDSDFEFHRSLVAAARSPRLSHSHELLCSETRLSLVPVRRMEQYRSGVYQRNEHEEILAIIKQGNVELAEARIRQHLKVGLNNALEMVRDKQAASRVAVAQKD